MELKPNDIREILRIFADSELEELRIDLGETRLHVSKGGVPLPTDAAAPPARPAAAAPAPSPASPAHDTVPKDGPGPSGATAAEVTASEPSDVARDGLVELRSPLLGVFYRRPSPDEAPFVEVGADVEEGDPVCVIDVMKMFTRVPAGASGRIAEICVDDGQLVEHGQVLMRIEPR